MIFKPFYRLPEQAAAAYGKLLQQCRICDIIKRTWLMQKFFCVIAERSKRGYGSGENIPGPGDKPESQA